jgi:hypothetical protein
MLKRTNCPRRLTLYLIFSFCLCGSARGDNLAADYAFMFLMTLSPDFAATNDTIENNDGPDVTIIISRLPNYFDLLTNTTQTLQLEAALAYQKTRQEIATFPGENIDSKWKTYGGSLGLLFEQQLTGHLCFTPSLRVGVARMDNDATYNGVLTNQLKDLYEGSLVNWQTDANVVTLGVGLNYDWSRRDRISRVKADVYHAHIDTFDESNAAVPFSEQANILSLRADMVFPSNFTVAENLPGFCSAVGNELLLWRKTEAPWAIRPPIKLVSVANCRSAGNIGSTATFVSLVSSFGPRT